MAEFFQNCWGYQIWTCGFMRFQVMYLLVWCTLGIVWTVRFNFVNIKKVKTKIILVVNNGETKAKVSTSIDRELCRHFISLFYYNTPKQLYITETVQVRQAVSISIT